MSDENRFPGLFYQRLRAVASLPLVQAALAGLLAWIVYLLTLTPTIAWGDSPELVSDAYELGIPHPTGYPLFMLLGHLAIRMLPWGDPAYRMNLMSAFFGGLAVAVAHRLAGRLTGSRFAAWITALALALAPLFWSEAVIAEVYALSALLVFCLLYQIAAWDETGDLRHLRLAALFTGLNLAHHLSVSLLAPGLIGFALTSPHRRAGLRRLPELLGLMLLPLLLYLYLPIRARADPYMNWGDTRTLKALLYHATGRFYGPGMFAAPRSEVVRRARELPWLWGHNLGWAGVILSLAGMGSLLWRPVYLVAMAVLRSRRFTPSLEFLTEAWSNWRWAWLLGTWATLDLVWASQYFMFDYQVFYLPALLALTLLTGLGAHTLAGAFERALAQWRDWLAEQGREVSANLRVARIAGAALASAIFAWPVISRWRENDMHRDWSTLRYARAVAQALPRHAVVFGEEDHYWFPLFYEKVVEQALPDSLVFNLLETPRPESYRLFARFRSHDFAVLPVPAFGVPGRQRSDYDFLRSLFQANVVRRPVVFLGEPWVLDTEEIKTFVADTYRAWRSNLPLVEFYPIPPRFQPQPPISPPLVTFPDGTQLQQFSATYEPDRGVQWVHLHYRWSVAVKAPWETLSVRTWLADPQGRIPETYDTPDAFHVALRDSHPMGYGYLPVILPGKPLVFDEDEWIFVGQEYAPQTYAINMELWRDNQLVKRTDGKESSTLGAISIPPPPKPPAAVTR